MIGFGYGMKIPPKPSVKGVGMSLVVGEGFTSHDLFTVMKGENVPFLSITLGVVIGLVPGGADTGGFRTGLGVTGGVKCSEDGCTLGISVGVAASAVGPGPYGACPLGPKVPPL